MGAGTGLALSLYFAKLFAHSSAIGKVGPFQKVNQMNQTPHPAYLPKHPANLARIQATLETYKTTSPKKQKPETAIEKIYWCA